MGGVAYVVKVRSRSFIKTYHNYSIVINNKQIKNVDTNGRSCKSGYK
jgi:hypothetical protein